jgi:hypothetical protein
MADEQQLAASGDDGNLNTGFVRQEDAMTEKWPVPKSATCADHLSVSHISVKYSRLTFELK